MKRNTFIIKLKPGMKSEYKRRHDDIWPELSANMVKQGIHNYTIWYYENLCFAYFETGDDGPKPLTSEAELKVGEKWEEYMSDIIEIVMDPVTGERASLELMFLHE
jgi:L-rhamnose mutarotase